MANEEQLSILKQGFNIWNTWRDKNPNVKIDLTNANLRGAILTVTENEKLEYMDRLRDAIHNNTKLPERGSVNFSGADLSGADLTGAKFDSADFKDSNLTSVWIYRGSGYNALFHKANLTNAKIWDTDLTRARFNEANLTRASFKDSTFVEADFTKATMIGTELENANLFKANLSQAILTEAILAFANLNNTTLTQADLRGAILHGASLIGANVDRANISGSVVYGINIWSLEGEFKEQKDLSVGGGVTVDNVKVAQFVYLILNNRELRNVINTLTSKTVLILGRFAITERKAILDTLRNKLHEYDLVPIVFDFVRPTDKDFTETIKTLAGLSYFIIADITNPKSSPLELQATVPDYQIPFVPIIQEGESPFAMMVDLQNKYPWVLPTKSYDSIETLMSALKPGIIDPAVEMRNKLRLVKAQEQVTESLRDYVDKSL